MLRRRLLEALRSRICCCADLTNNDERSCLTMDAITNGAVRFLTGDFPFSGELQCFWMAVQGAMAVRKGPNRNGNLHWFHAFALSVLAGYAGASFGFLWMGRPSSMLSSDLNMASCILAYILVNYTPMDIGYKICDSLPVTIVTVSFSQLFRSLGIMKFATACFEAFKDNPSAYYPIPVFGPIIYATLLGNMGGFFMKGFEGHLANGMPWPVQNGMCFFSCCVMFELLLSGVFQSTQSSHCHHCLSSRTN